MKKFSQLKKNHKVIFAIIIGFAVVSFWRGAWGILDTYLFPNNYSLSSWISFIMGITILLVTHYTVRELA